MPPEQWAATKKRVESRIEAIRNESGNRKERNQILNVNKVEFSNAARMDVSTKNMNSNVAATTSSTKGRTHNYLTKTRRRRYAAMPCARAVGDELELDHNARTMEHLAKITATATTTALSRAATSGARPTGTSQHLGETTRMASDRCEAGGGRADAAAICLLCRQHMVECCWQCCRHFAATATSTTIIQQQPPATTTTTTTTTTTSTDYNIKNTRRNSLSAVQSNHNNNKNNNTPNNSNKPRIERLNTTDDDDAKDAGDAFAAEPSKRPCKDASDLTGPAVQQHRGVRRWRGCSTTPPASSALSSSQTSSSTSPTPFGTTFSRGRQLRATSLPLPALGRRSPDAATCCCCATPEHATSAATTRTGTRMQRETGMWPGISTLIPTSMPAGDSDRLGEAGATAADCGHVCATPNRRKSATTSSKSNCGNNRRRHVRHWLQKCFSLCGALRTLRMLFVLQLLRNIFYKFSHHCHQHRENNPAMLMNSASSNHNNNNNNNNNNINNNSNLNKRQQRPPMLRLRFRRNSYYNNSSSVNKHSNNATNYFNTSHQAERRPQSQPKLSANHHESRKSPSSPNSRHFKMPNLSLFHAMLIGVSFLALLLPAAHAAQQHIALGSGTSIGSAAAAAAASALAPSAAAASLSTALEAATQQRSATTASSQVRLWRNETVCKSLDIRNEPNELAQLVNCTVIEGFLLITLMNTHKLAEFTQTFPLLTEVTEYVIVYRVHNLRSLSQIFPNLSIIRGRELFEGYAMVLYSNPHLEDLGLSKLTTISRGGVRIENNLSLCFVDTIDWHLILSNATDIFKKNNRASFECPQCPGTNRISGSGSPSGEKELVCRESKGARRCWNNKACQRICPERCRNNCVDENTCCNEACIGGCSPDNLNECNSCRHFSIYNNSCIDKCPHNYFKYLDRRCLTAETCGSIGTKFENNKQETLVPYEGACTTRCPDGYDKVENTCQKCGDKCVKKCEGGLIDSVARAKDYFGCTHIIKEGLTISIKRGGRHLMEDLEASLSSIEVIETYLRVHRTFGMISLQYFKNLRVIEGQQLCEERFALYVLENNDLETIWGPNKTVRIEKGRVFFHFNPKLCYSVIDDLRPMLTNNATFDKNEVATDSNGSKGSCNTEILNTTVYKTSSSIAIVDIVNPLKFDDDRTFIGYQYFHIEDKTKSATKHGHRLCDDGWIASEPTKETRHIITELLPFTDYAYYVKTMTISSEPRNAQSPIQYFKTKSSKPSHVQKLRAYADSPFEITLNWLPPKAAYGNLTKFIIRAVLDQRNQVQGLLRNYCDDPVQKSDTPDKEQDVKPITEKPQVAADCNCPKTKEGGYDNEEVADATIHDGIDFENSLQNFIYVKQQKNDSLGEDDVAPAGETELAPRRDRRHAPQELDGFDSFLIRHMRELPREHPREPPAIADVLANSILGSGIGSGSGPFSSTVATTTDVAPTDDATRMDENDEYYESIVVDVNATTTKFVFNKLKHFSMYVLGVAACREPELGSNEKECSDVLVVYVRTKPLDNVDKIENLGLMLEATNTSRSNIRMRWDPPQRPNGAIVSYTISYKSSAPDSVEESRCITELDYRNMTNGYLLTGLATGNYSIRVRANSLAGDGLYSDFLYMDVPPTKMSPTVYIIISVLLFVALLVIIGVFIFMRKRILAPTSDMKIITTVNPYYMQYIPDEWEVKRDRVLQLSPLGQGSFGMVYQGLIKGYNNSTEDTPCAIKTVNENATDRERGNFLSEASVMKMFDTHHVVRLLGVCSQGQPALVIMELMKRGDLKSYLRAHRPDERDDGEPGMGMDGGAAIGLGPGGIGGGVGDPMLQPPPLERIYQMAIEIADGMAYLAAKKFVHRDLAARNCMVADDLTVKIGDFGMTRDIYETDYYRKGTKGLLPVRWMPPESLRDGVYSSASDVFSYGVVLWEMATLASQPYQGFSNDQVLRYVIDGGVMERPENCPDKLYRLMQRCWHHRPSARPAFMDIIAYLEDLSYPHFSKVSFYHSPEGQQARAKERGEHLGNSAEIFDDHDNDLDADATTPLREYKLTINNSSAEQHGDIDDDLPHSPYSVASANFISSTPDGQSKNSLNLSQLSHNNNATTLSSAPSATAGALSGDGAGVGGGGSGGGDSGSHLRHTHPHQRQLHQPVFYSRYPHISVFEEKSAPYVQSDFEVHDFVEDDAVGRGAGSGGLGHGAGSSVVGGSGGKSVEADERGYEMYDPSPNYREHAPPSSYDDDEDDFKRPSGMRRAHKLSGGENLLPRQKAGRQRLPTIMPMSSSVPDEAIGAPMSSSLHPSTASAASSNASSTAAASGSGVAGGSGGGKYPSLKKAVAETVQSVGNSLLPARLLSINRRFFNHKRSGSNASHKSTSSNPNTASSNSSTNLTGSGRGKSLSGQNLGTIESGGSGSAGSYCPTPRFFSSAHGPAISLSDNPNYQLLDETANSSCLSADVAGSSSAAAAGSDSPAGRSAPLSSSSGFTTTTNPNYQLLNESLNTTATPTKSSPLGASSTHGRRSTSENPNYAAMPAPSGKALQTTDNPNYVPMNTSEYELMLPPAIVPVAASEMPRHRDAQSGYHEMMPSGAGTTGPGAADRGRTRLHNSATLSTSSTSSSEDEADDDDEHTEHIKMERIPLNRRRSSERSSKRGSNRSRSQSRNKLDEKAPLTALPQLSATSQAKPSSTTYSLKEKWLRQQQAQSTPPPPPPNGFIGREA